jgi:hypothetical protein
MGMGWCCQKRKRGVPVEPTTVVKVEGCGWEQSLNEDIEEAPGPMPPIIGSIKQSNTLQIGLQIVKYHHHHHHWWRPIFLVSTWRVWIQPMPLKATVKAKKAMDELEFYYLWMGEKLATAWFGGGSPIYGAPQLLPCAEACPSWKELGMLNHLPGLSGPVERPHLSS